MTGRLEAMIPFDKWHLKVLLRMTLIAAVTAIAACGGGGGGETPPAVVLPPPSWGQVDRAFGTDGRVLLAHSEVPIFVPPQKRMAVTGDGSVYVAGYYAIEKVDRSGALVASFGTAGRVTLPFSPEHPASAPVLDEAGSLYVISGAGIAKLDSTGHLVPSFGSNGYASLGSWGRGSQDAFSLLVRDAAGSLYLGGYGRSPETGIFSGGVAKFDRDGRLVASFGSSGVRILELGGGRTVIPQAMAVDGGGNVFIAGERLVKLDSSGNLAADFAAGGLWEVPDCVNGSGASAVAIDAIGNLVVGANCPGSPLLFRLDAGGNVVASFRESGRRSGLLGTGTFTLGSVTTTNTVGYVTTLLIGPGGHIYAAGYRDRLTCAWDLAVAKLDASGNALPVFDASDAVILDGQPKDFASDLAMDAAGQLYVGGVRMPASVCPQRRPVSGSFVVYRLGA